MARCIKTARFLCLFGEKMCFYYKYYNYVLLISGAEDKRHCIIYIVYSIANVFCVSLRIWLCIYGITLRVSLYDVKIAWIERRLASPHLLFLFKEIVSARWEHFRGRIHRLKSFVQERYRTGEQNASRSGTLRREQSPALP